MQREKHRSWKNESPDCLQRESQVEKINENTETHEQRDTCDLIYINI